MSKNRMKNDGLRNQAQNNRGDKEMTPPKQPQIKEPPQDAAVKPIRKHVTE